MNVVSEPGSVKQSNVDLDNLAKAVYKASKIIALGNFPSESLHRLGVPHFKLPHPSPLNRQINDPQYIQNCLRECRRYLYD